MRRSMAALGMICLALCWAAAASASIVIGGTRVIYPADQREVSVSLTNSGDSPSLVQVWVDDGDASVSPDDSAAPFVIFPPISRVEVGGGQALRLVFSGETALPQDRESLFWLNVLDVPPRPQADEQGPRNLMQLAFRSRIKLFYRPSGLEGRASQAPDELRWSRGSDAQGGAALVVRNASGFHVNLSRVEIQGVRVDIGDGLVPPHGEASFALPSHAGGSRGTFTFINDYGGHVSREFAL